MTDRSWIARMDYHNLLTIYDVLIDINREADLSPSSVTLPILPPAIKFHELLPADTIPLRDHYLQGRWKALKFLKRQGVISALKAQTASHRWQTQAIMLPNRAALEDFLGQVKAEGEKRAEKRERREAKAGGSFWDTLHPKVVELAKPRFGAGHLADAVEAAMKEVNVVVKILVKLRTGKEYDGADLMRKAFTSNGPILTLADMSTESGRTEQQGYMDIFAGAMTGIRNPKAHQNIVIDEKRAIHLLHLASLLMYKIDEVK